MRRQQAGFNLIEVLVATLLLSVGLVGLVAVQARAVHLAVSVEDSQRATLLAQDLAASMWGQMDVNLVPAQIDAWKARVADPARGGLPRGVGSVSVDGNTATIVVSWLPPGRAEGSEHRYFTELEIR